AFSASPASASRPAFSAATPPPAAPRSPPPVASATAPTKPDPEDRIAPVGTAYTPVHLPAPKKLKNPFAKFAPPPPVPAGRAPGNLTWSECQAQAKEEGAAIPPATLARRWGATAGGGVGSEVARSTRTHGRCRARADVVVAARDGGQARSRAARRRRRRRLAPPSPPPSKRGSRRPIDSARLPAPLRARDRSPASAPCLPATWRRPRRGIFDEEKVLECAPPRLHNASCLDESAGEVRKG
ncbi:uncharacterized protein SCHCODRAFT_02537359, partial [Schizophyllum commune H4-8]|uniref:uncharacterized protein n=1 Tax=Schizophyllum commune (strain H4-8 / FGSC 9210) TaxID=578458 RepID=UPI00215FC796